MLCFRSCHFHRARGVDIPEEGHFDLGIGGGCAGRRRGDLVTGGNVLAVGKEIQSGLHLDVAMRPRKEIPAGAGFERGPLPDL